MKTIHLLFVFLLVVSVVVAIDSEEIEEGRQLVESNVTCDSLNDNQLEAIGEYYMEQVHPKQAHDAMHQMMGLEEDTAAHDEFHIQLALRHYCNYYSGSGMMGGRMMNYRGYIGMRNYGEASADYPDDTNKEWKEQRTWTYRWYSSIVCFLFLALLVGLVVLVYLWIIRQWNSLAKEKRR